MGCWLLPPDLPGHGATPGPFSLERAVASIRATILGEAEPVHLVAVSGSVSVALLVALAEPAHVAGLILSGGTARGGRGDAVTVVVAATSEGLKNPCCEPDRQDDAATNTEAGRSPLQA
ncbi:alpha/beta fold hydrolase [Nonomuraea polychroma]|uniref:alpha/beta fold hydrolase n=1 Tax=Nonomuraea polychroma TaxID=46176 RepID=UPI000FDF5442